MADARLGYLEHGALEQLAQSMVGQESAGLLAGILLRLARYLGGDPAQWLIVTSANFTTVAQLPDNTNAQSFIGQVTGNSIQYRIDGSTPIASDPLLPPGTVVTLTGRPSIQSFRFLSNSIGAASLVGAYYD